MKNVLFTTTFLLAFFSQIQSIFSQYQNYPSSKKLIEIPTFPHQRAIDVFDIGEKPDSAYYKLSILEVYRNSNDTYISVINELKAQAQDEGMDGIMIFKMGLVQKSYTDSEGYNNNYSVKEGVAYGIKYPTSFDYLTQIPEVESIYIYNDSTMAFSAAHFRQFDLFGKTIAHNCSNSFYNFLYQYSLYHLVEEKENWTYLTSNNVIIGREFKATSRNKKCQFYYDSLYRLNEIRSETYENTSSYMTFTKERIALFYNENGQLHQKDIYPNLGNETAFYREIFRYDDLGRIEEKLIFKYSTGERTPIAKCFYPEFYNLEAVKMIFPELK
jgi:hypothetical protein